MICADWRRWDGLPTVYRLFDAQDDLLYVGCSTHVGDRLYTHSRGWMPIERAVIRLHASLADALAAELRAIKTERPRFNIHGRPWPKTPGDARDYMLALDKSPGSHTDMQRRRRMLLRLVAEPRVVTASAPTV